MHAANRADLNVLPSAVMIYDERERLQAWNDKVALFYPTIAPWLAVGASLESLAEKFIDARRYARRLSATAARRTIAKSASRATAGFTFSISGWRMVELSVCIPTSPSLTRPDAHVTSFTTIFYSLRSRSRSASGTGRSPTTTCR
mgnify:CR=1 FL=1